MNYVYGREGDCEVCVDRTIVAKNKKLHHTQMIIWKDLNCCIFVPSTEVEKQRGLLWLGKNNITVP